MSYCTKDQVKERVLINSTDTQYDLFIDSAISEASRLVDTFIKLYIEVPLSSPPVMIGYITADFAASIFKRRYIPDEVTMRGTLQPNGLNDMDASGFFATGMTRLQHYIRNTYELTVELNSINNPDLYLNLEKQGLITKAEARKFMNDAICIVENKNTNKRDIENLVREETVIIDHSKRQSRFNVVSGDLFGTGYVTSEDRYWQEEDGWRRPPYNQYVPPVIPPTAQLTVIYMPNNAISGTVPVDSKLYSIGDTVQLFANTGNLTRIDYRFGGWSFNSASNYPDFHVTGNTVSPPSFVIGASNILLFATWILIPRYEIVYDGNSNTGGNAPIDNNSPYQEGSTVIILGVGNMVKENHEFLGWSTNPNATVPEFTTGQTLTININVNLFAVWREFPKFAVTYVSTGHTSGTVPVDTNSPYYSGKIVTVLSQGTLLKENYKFLGWFTSINAVTPTHLPNDTFTINTDMTFYAVWEELPKYTVTYFGNTNTSGTAPVDPNSPYFSGKTVTVLGQGTLVKDNNKFLGWSPNINAITPQYIAGDIFTITTNTTLFAVWKELDKFEIIYDGNGNTTGTSPIEQGNPFYINSVVTVLDKGNLAKLGHEFVEWNTEPDGTGISYNPNDTVTLTDDVFLFAIWNELTFTITYNMNDGTNSPNNPTTYKSSQLPIQLELPTLLGYSLNYWMKLNPNLQLVNGVIPTGLEGNLTIEAVWNDTPTLYNLNFILNGGTLADGTPTNYDILSNVTFKIPSQTNFTFTGWTVVFTDGTPPITTPKTILSFTAGSHTGDITLTATWVRPVYTVTWNANGGSLTGPDTSSVYAGDSITDVATPDRSGGWDFKGWNISQSAAPEYDMQQIPFTPTGNMTLYAIWQPIPIAFNIDPTNFVLSSNMSTLSLNQEFTVPSTILNVRAVSFFRIRNNSNINSGDSITGRGFTLLENGNSIATAEYAEGGSSTIGRELYYKFNTTVNLNTGQIYTIVSHPTVSSGASYLAVSNSSTSEGIVVGQLYSVQSFNDYRSDLPTKLLFKLYQQII